MVPRISILLARGHGIIVRINCFSTLYSFESDLLFYDVPENFEKRYSLEEGIMSHQNNNSQFDHLIINVENQRKKIRRKNVSEKYTLNLSRGKPNLSVSGESGFTSMPLLLCAQFTSLHQTHHRSSNLCDSQRENNENDNKN
jgi:hypothetical protein